MPTQAKPALRGTEAGQILKEETDALIAAYAPEGAKSGQGLLDWTILSLSRYKDPRRQYCSGGAGGLGRRAAGIYSRIFSETATRASNQGARLAEERQNRVVGDIMGSLSIS